jgi:hypothetical protein
MGTKLELVLSPREAEALFTAVCLYQDRILKLPPAMRDDELDADFDVMVAVNDKVEAFLHEFEVEEGFNGIMRGITEMLRQEK